MNDDAILLAIFIGGTISTVVGVFMWQGAWAALAAWGLLAALFAMSQAIVRALSAVFTATSAVVEEIGRAASAGRQ
jgi:hypothetical protein